MAVAVTRVGNRTVFGDKHVVIADLVFSGNYATGGEAITPAALGFSNSVDFVITSPSTSTALTTGEVVIYNHSTGKFLFYEAAAANAPLAEKANAEAYVAGTTVRVLAVGRGV